MTQVQNSITEIPEYCVLVDSATNRIVRVIDSGGCIPTLISFPAVVNGLANGDHIIKLQWCSLDGSIVGNITGAGYFDSLYVYPVN